MRILVLSKRQYTGRDLLDDRYGRLFEIPRGLAAQGHKVYGLALSYRQRNEGVVDLGWDLPLQWESINGRPFSPWTGRRYWRRLFEIVQSFQPDLIWASSDAWHIVTAGLAKGWTGVPFVADFYDNYESFGLNRIPGVTASMRRACRRALGLTLVGSNLSEYVRERYRLRNVPTLVLGNATDLGCFHPVPKETARRLLGLPNQGLLIGTAGALRKNRGISALLDGFGILRQRFPDLRLVLAGPRDGTLKRYSDAGILDLGILPPAKTALVFSALDTAVICNRDSSFGRYCYPQKFQEIVACGTPVVAARVGEMGRLLEERPDQLFPPDSAELLADRVARQLLNPTPFPLDHAVSWEARAKTLGEFMEELLPHQALPRNRAIGA